MSTVAKDRDAKQTTTKVLTPASTPRKKQTAPASKSPSAAASLVSKVNTEGSIKKSQKLGSSIASSQTHSRIPQSNTPSVPSQKCQPNSAIPTPGSTRRQMSVPATLPQSPPPSIDQKVQDKVLRKSLAGKRSITERRNTKKARTSKSSSNQLAIAMDSSPFALVNVTTPTQRPPVVTPNERRRTLSPGLSLESPRAEDQSSKPAKDLSVPPKKVKKFVKKAKAKATPIVSQESSLSLSKLENAVDTNATAITDDGSKSDVKQNIRDAQEIVPGSVVLNHDNSSIEPGHGQADIKSRMTKMISSTAKSVAAMRTATSIQTDNTNASDDPFSIADPKKSVQAVVDMAGVEGAIKSHKDTVPSTIPNTDPSRQASMPRAKHDEPPSNKSSPPSESSKFNGHVKSSTCYDIAPPVTHNPSPQPPIPDLAKGLVGLLVSDFGNILSSDGDIVGTVEGDLPSMLGNKISASGEVLDIDGHVCGKVSKNFLLESAGMDDPPISVSEDEAGNIVGEKSRCGSGDDSPQHDDDIIGCVSIDRAGRLIDDQGRIIGRIADMTLPGVLSPSVSLPPQPQNSPLPATSNLKAGTKTQKHKTATNGAREERGKLSQGEEQNPDIFLGIKSTREGIQMTIRIPTGFAKGFAVQMDQ